MAVGETEGALVGDGLALRVGDALWLVPGVADGLPLADGLTLVDGLGEIVTEGVGASDGLGEGDGEAGVSIPALPKSRP